jgi:hypothetical protein
MLKIWILVLFTCVCGYSQAQVNYYNITQDFDTVHNGFHGIAHYSGDTVLINGFLRDQSNKRYRTFCYLNAINGDSITSFKYGRDTIDIYGGNTIDMCIVGSEIFACGAYYKNGKTYANILKFSIVGELLLDSLYFKEFEWTEFDCIIPTNDGNFLLVGSKEIIPGNLDAWLVKMDLNGNILWEKDFDNSTYDCAIKITPHLNNFLVSAGKTDPITNKIDFWLICIDVDGNVVWEKTYGGPYYDGGNAISLQNNEIHISGSRDYAPNKKESYIMRLNSIGELIWEKSLFTMVTPNAPSSLGINLELSDGSIIMGGTTYENDSPFDFPVARIFKMNQNGDSLWTRILKLRNNDNYLTDIKVLDNGDLIFAGYVFPDSPDNTQDGWIMRANCLGYFEHPKDSIVFDGNGSNILSLSNYSSFYEYTIIDWGDNSSDTVYESGNQNLIHEYSLPGNYIVNSQIVACNDTIRIQYEYLVIPEQFGAIDLVIFPNPNQGEFEIWLDSKEEFNIQIVDVNGKILKTLVNTSLYNGYKLDISEFSNSIYFIKATSTNLNQTFQTKIAVSK